ncbi:hypothetical protein [Pedobacter mendelii]|uniref:DUF1566 domain-containing protein n=1 Tax=Pedobacter mendelii TaxID=1908240 RepID=A0ABQ2BDV4_9SPHI|nr:hypothetical protein [Pedobacter mendelii]GGI23639.1 hypothetical protein GCM10008119_08650 [Pedobacter mendelii]
MKKILFALALIGIISCKKSNSNSNGTQPEPKPIVLHKVGDSFGGGIIIRVISETGEHGTIVSPQDQTTSGCQWAVVGKSGKPDVVGANGALINTNKILAFYGNNANIAAKIAKDYKGGGYSDWCLPMNVDLQAMYKNRNLLGSYTSQYWSCQEGADLNPSSSPYFYSMIYGNSLTGSGGAVINVRAVREY